jgi:hypothetical protein
MANSQRDSGYTTGNSRFGRFVVARFAERSRLSCRFISVRNVVRIRFLYSSDRRRRPYAMIVSLFAVAFTQSAISVCRVGVVLPTAISRRSSEQSCSTVVRKCWTQRTSVSSSRGTGSWHQHRLAEVDMVADINRPSTVSMSNSRTKVQSKRKPTKRREQAGFAANRRPLHGFQPQMCHPYAASASPFGAPPPEARRMIERRITALLPRI